MNKVAEIELKGYELKLDNPMLRRGFMMLEDEEFDEAKEQFGKVLDEVPECAEAYVGKLLAELKLTDIALLARVKAPFEDKASYRRAVKFADEALAEYLKECAIAALELYESGARVDTKEEEIKEKPQQRLEENNIAACEVVDLNLTFAKKGDGYVVVSCDNSATEVVVPDSYNGLPVVEIGENAFRQCKNLTSVVIGDSVTSIGRGAFGGCSNLENIALPFVGGSSKESDETHWYPFGYIFGKEKYSGCVETSQYYKGKYYIRLEYCIPLTLKSVTIAGDKILCGAFSGCNNIQSIEISNSVTSIGDRAFSGCSGLKSIEIPNSVTSIGASAFSGCSRLKSIEIPNSVTSIGDSAFSGCSGLKSIEIPNSVTSIAANAFFGCAGLKSIIIPDSVTSIGNWAFSGCAGLKSIIIPDSVISISNAAFDKCTSLISVVILGSITRIHGDAFFGCPSISIYYRGSKKYFSGVVPSWFDMEKVYFYSEKKTLFGGKQWHYVDGVPTKW